VRQLSQGRPDMKAVLTAAAVVLCTAPLGSAQSILGTWTCARTTADNDAISNVTFNDNGRLDALVNIEFLGLDQEVSAQARYRSDYLLDNGMLSDTPVSALSTVRTQRAASMQTPCAKDCWRTTASAQR